MDFSFNTASMIGTGISAGISAVGSIFTTRYNNAIAKAQANIAKENAKTMELQAQYTLFAAETKVQHETMQAGQVKARQKAALAANGVAIGRRRLQLPPTPSRRLTRIALRPMLMPLPGAIASGLPTSKTRP